jgi:hypothetical protein
MKPMSRTERRGAVEIRPQAHEQRQPPQQAARTWLERHRQRALEQPHLERGEQESEGLWAGVDARGRAFIDEE